MLRQGSFVPDERCRVTVIGGRKSIDLAIPARAPICEYAPRLAGICGEEESEAMPPVWSLATAEGPALAPGISLEQAGVLDGTVLYLRDCRADEDYDLTVVDLDDQVSSARENSALWSARHRAQSVVAAGLFVCVLAAGTLAFRHQAVFSFAFFSLAGLGSALTGWYAERKSWPVPSTMRQVLALAACPLLACAGLGGPVYGAVATPVAVSVGAACGALAGLVALPAVSTVVMQLVTTLVMVLVVPLTVFGADRMEAAAVTAVVLLLLLRALPRAASQIAVLLPGTPRERLSPESGDVADAVRRSDLLLTFLTVLCALVLGGGLVALSVSRSGYAFGLLGCVAAALLFEAGSSRLLSVVAPQLAVGTLGLTLLAVRLTEVLFDTAVPGALTVFLVGVVLTGCGLGLAFRTAVRTVDLSERPKWLTGVGGFLVVVCVPLAAGVFGVFGQLAGAGSSL
jgi:type VII secretion integral membrane protein EccD